MSSSSDLETSSPLITRRRVLRVAGLAGLGYLGTRAYGLSQQTENTPIPSADDPGADPSPSPTEKPEDENKKPTEFQERSFYIGPDTSQFQNRYMDYEKLADQGVAFAMARAGYWILNKDMRIEDELFAGSRERIHDAGLLPGSYYFIRRDNAKAQADHFVEILRDTDPITKNKKNRGALSNIRGWLMLDLEPSPSDGTKPTFDNGVDFRARLDELLPGYPVVPYSYPYYWRDTLKAQRAFKNSKLWAALPQVGSHNPYQLARDISKPGSANDPYRKYPWPGYETYMIRQYTATASLQGFKKIDFNISFAKWKDLLAMARMDASEVRNPGKLAKKP